MFRRLLGLVEGSCKGSCSGFCKRQRDCRHNQASSSPKEAPNERALSYVQNWYQSLESDLPCRRTLWLDKNTRRKSRVFYYSCEYKIAARKCNLAFQGVRIILPFVSTPHISTMVQIAMTIQQKEAKIQELKNLMSVFRIEDHLKNTQILKKIQSG